MTPCIYHNQHFFKHYEKKAGLNFWVYALILAADGWNQIIHASQSFSEE